MRARGGMPHWGPRPPAGSVCARPGCSKDFNPMSCLVSESFSRGPPEGVLRLPVHMVEYAIGVDLGGTNLRAAAIDRTGKMLDKISGSTNFTEGRDAVLTDIVSAITALRKK